jgi:hypothetical protein
MKGQAKITAEAPEISDPTESNLEAATTDDAEPSKKDHVLKPTSAMQAIRSGEDVALREYLEALGTGGAFRVRIMRTAPKILRVNGRDYSTAGHLDTVNEAIDEQQIGNEYGGGTYDLTVTTRRKDNSYKYAGHRTITIAGDPKIEKLPTNATQASTPSTPPNSNDPTLVKEMMGVLTGELRHAREAKPEGIPPAIQILLEQMKEDARRRDQDLQQFRRELAEAQTRKPPEDTFKDKLLSTLVDGESGRILSIRAQHESEMRTAKEGHLQEIRLIEDRHDRTVRQMQQSHEIMLSNMKASYEREIAALNASHQVTAAATTTTSSVTITTLKSDIQRLEREVDTLRSDNKELREKKDKPLLEQLKDIKTLREAISDGDDGDSSAVQQAIAAVPAVVESIGGLIQMRQQQQAGQPQQTQQPQAAAKSRIVKNPQTGQRFLQQGGKVIPAQVKPKTITTEAGEQIEIPKIEAPTLTLLITMLEAAYGRQEDPDIVAQTGKAQIPPDILAWIRQNHTEQVSGVDLFMTKVAKLPGTSSLASHAGRTWLRKVGLALIGE